MSLTASCEKTAQKSFKPLAKICHQGQQRAATHYAPEPGQQDPPGGLSLWIPKTAFCSLWQPWMHTP